MRKEYGYVRVSTTEQSLDRQIRNIKAVYPNAIIVADEYTGTKMDRPSWNNLYKSLKKGDTVIFDSVSRMSRNAEEGFKVYQELYERGCELIFLKEPYINTDSYKNALKGAVKIDAHSPDQAANDLISGITLAVNKFIMAKVREDIKKSFEQSQKEVDDLRQRIKEGMAVAKLNGKSIGRSKGDKLNVKKAQPIKTLIRKYSRDFDGTLTDMELLAVLSTKTVKISDHKRNGQIRERYISAKLSRNTLYKYKKEMKE